METLSDHRADRMSIQHAQVIPEDQPQTNN